MHTCKSCVDFPKLESLLQEVSPCCCLIGAHGAFIVGNSFGHVFGLMEMLQGNRYGTKLGLVVPADAVALQTYLLCPLDPELLSEIGVYAQIRS